LSHEEESHFLRLELETKALYVGELERIRREREQRIEELAMQVSELSSRAAALDHAKQQITAELRDVVRERDELVAFTQRASIRMADKLAAVLSRVPGVLGGLRWARRTFGGRTPSGH
jgi:TolA-binding protein